MHLLEGTPYLLDDATGPKIVRAASDLEDQVANLRSSGTMNLETLKRLREEWGVVQVYESAGIEGNSLDLSETRMAIQRGITISGKPTGHSDEVRNLHLALEYLESLASAKGAPSEREIREIHALVVGDDDPNRGRYRSIDVEISHAPHKPPSHLLVPDQMAAFGAWITRSESVVPPLLLAAVCHAWLVHIHPFHDGNGRTARAVTNLLLMRRGVPVVVIRRKDRQRYYEALRASDECDIGPFVELLVDRCRDSIRQIDRVNTAAGGLSLALAKVRAADERRYRTWADGIRLLATAMEDAFKLVEEADASFQSSVQRYDLPSFEDYQMLSIRDPSGATWLERYEIRRAGVRKAALLWTGFSSDPFIQALGAPSPFPSIWVSMENPARAPRWIPADASFPAGARELAFHDGRFVARMDSGAVRKYDSVTALATEFVAALVGGWFGD
jgi:Fic family protein